MKNPGGQIHIDNVKKGDLGPFTFLVEKYKNMAYTIAIKILGNAEDAEDAAQERFVKAYLQINALLFDYFFRLKTGRLAKS